MKVDEYIVSAQPENFSIEKLDTKYLMSKGQMLFHSLNQQTRRDPD